VQALKRMAGKASGDIRSCLNTLQLLVARHGRVSAAHVAGAAVGEKDMTTAPFEVWEQLLSSRRPRHDDMLRCLMAFGEHDLVRPHLLPPVPAAPARRTRLSFRPFPTMRSGSQPHGARRSSCCMSADGVTAGRPCVGQDVPAAAVHLTFCSAGISLVDP